MSDYFSKMASLRQRFLNNLPDRIDALIDAISALDNANSLNLKVDAAAALYQTVHDLSSIAPSMGCERLTEATLGLENMIETFVREARPMSLEDMEHVKKQFHTLKSIAYAESQKAA